jgi:hypothetical protein
MTKRTKKKIGTRRRKTRPDYRKKTFRNKKYRNRKTRRGYRGGEGSDDEEESKEESVAGITTGLRNLDVNQSSSSSRDVDNITTGVENLNVNDAEEEKEEDECPICGLPYTNEENGPMITTTCGHKFHKTCLCKWCHKGTCPICRTDIKDTTCNQYCKYYLKIEKTSKLFSPQNPRSSVVLYMLLEEMMEVVNELRDTTPDYRDRLESELQIVKDAIKTLLINPALDLTRINLPPPHRPLTEIFVYMLQSKDPELIDLYLNKRNPGLTDRVIRDAKKSIRDIDLFAAVIEKMKNHPLRSTNFPNLVNFDKESADEIFSKGLKGPPTEDTEDIEVMRQALNMPDINITKALCLMIKDYDNQYDSDDNNDQDEEETKEEDIPENLRFTGNSIRRLKEEIILDPEFDPLAMCTDENNVNTTILYLAIDKDDKKTVDALLENPRLQEGLTNEILSDLKNRVYHSAKNKIEFKRIIDYMKKKPNKPKFPNVNFSPTAFSIFTGGK